MKNTFLSKIILLSLTSLSIISLNSYSQPVNDNELEFLDNGFVFVEGPLWYHDMLIFSDLDGDKIYQWDEINGTTAFLDPSGKSNGLSIDTAGNLLMAQRTYRQVARMDSDENIVAIATHYKGKRLNCPNDIVVKSNGCIYFTDPTYGIANYQKELSFQGVYCLTPDSNLYLLDSLLAQPNGITLSPDETKLYASDAEVRIIWEWDIVNDSTLANKHQFARMTPIGYADGMKSDASGRIFATGPAGVWVFDTAGVFIDKIIVPDQNTTNCNWGDADGKTLYITSGKSIYRIRPNYDLVDTTDTTTTSIIPIKASTTAGIQSLYPNPFNNALNIDFKISEVQDVEISVLNNLGQVIEVLAKETYLPGVFSIQWQPKSSASSGLYFVRLETNTGFSIKPCVYSESKN